MKNWLRFGKTSLALGVLLAGAICFWGATAHAVVFSSVADGNWNVADTWGTTSYPAAGDDVTVINAVAIGTADAAADSLHITGETASVVISSTYSLTIDAITFHNANNIAITGDGQVIIGPSRNLAVSSPSAGWTDIKATIVDNALGASSVTIDTFHHEVNWTGSHTYSGGTIINGNEQLNANNVNCFGTGTVTLNDGTRLAYLQGQANALTINNGSLLGGSWNGPITLPTGCNAWANDGVNLNGKISGPGGINIGSGAAFTNAANDYTGKTSVYGGTLDIRIPWTNAGVAGPLGAPIGANATVDLYNGAGLFFTTPGQNSWSTDRTLNLAGDGDGTVTIRFNNNDTNFGLGAVTATGTGAKTLALYTGAGYNGDREAVIFGGPISDTADNKLSLNINFTTQTESQSYVSLSAVNTFTGPIALEQGGNNPTGYLTIGGVRTREGGTRGSGNLGNGNYPGDVSLGTRTILNYYSTSDQTLSGQISGVGSLVMDGTGTLTLTGDNIYTGVTTISSGTLQIGNGTSGQQLASPSIANGGALVFNHSDEMTYAGAISGNGSLTKIGTGTTVLTGANTGDGTTSVSGGVLRVAGASSLNSGLLTLSGGVLEVGNGDFGRDLGTDPGQVQIGAGVSGFSAYGADRTVTLGPDATVQWDSASFAPTTLVLNAATANSKLTLGNGIDLNGITRTIAVNANTAEITGDIIGNAVGLTKIGSGTLVLSGARNYTGETMVTEGELAAKGSFTGVITVGTGATVKPLIGTSLATPTLTMNATSSYKWLLGDITNDITKNSHIDVAGDVTLNGTPKLTIATAGGSPNPSTSYEILKYGGTRSGEFNPSVDFSIVNADTNKYWLAGNGEWLTTNNWSGGFSGGTISYNDVAKTVSLSGLTVSPSLPETGSDVVIAPSNDAVVTGPSAPGATVKTLLLGNGTNAISLTVQNGGPLAVTGATTITGATLTLNDAMTTTSGTSSGTSTLNGAGGSLGTSGTPLASFTVASGTTSLGGTVTVYTDNLAVTGAVNLNTGSTVITKGVTGAGTVNFDGGTLKAAANIELKTVPAAIKAGGAVIDSNGNAVTVKQVFGDGGNTNNGGGLTVQGAGSVILTKAQTYTGATMIQNGGTLTLQGAPDAPPVTDYARWFDASNLGLSDNAPVTQWNDLSTNAANATVPDGNATPVYVANAGAESGLGAIYFAKNDGAGNSGALGFARDSSIRTVFSIFKGNSFLLTDTDTYHFHRPGDDNPSDQLIANYDAAPIVAGSTYVNGTLVDPENDTMPTDLHNGFNLVEILTNGDPVQADSFNKDRTYHAGDQYQAEVIMYDRVLTEAERLSVESYLNGKWFGSGGTGGGSDLLPITTAVTLGSSSTLDLNGTNQQVASLADALGASGHKITMGSGTLTVGTSAGSTIFSGEISGTGGFTKLGASTQILSGINTYTGVTTMSGGTLSVAAIGDGGAIDSNLGSATNQASNLVFDGGTLKYTGATASSDRAFTISDGKAATIEVAGMGTNLTMSGSIPATAGALTKTGAGTLTLTGVHSYAGGTNVNAGTLTVSGSGTLGATTGVLTMGGGALNLGGTSNLDGTTQTVGAVNINAAAASGDTIKNGILISDSYAANIAAGGNAIVSAKLSDRFLAEEGPKATLTKSGAGTLTLTGANDYTGLTTVTSGSLVLGKDAHIAVIGDGTFGTVSGGKADIRAGKLIFDYTGGDTPAGQIETILTASYGSSGQTPFAEINGANIYSSTGTGKALGWADDTTAKKVTVMYTLYGDATLDGTVNFDDLNKVLTSYNQPGTWATGDFTYDGNVNFDDLNKVLTAYNTSLGVGDTISGAGLDGQAINMLSGSGFTVVPEPSSVVLLLAGLMGLLAYGWRKRK